MVKDLVHTGIKVHASNGVLIDAVSACRLEATVPACITIDPSVVVSRDVGDAILNAFLQERYYIKSNPNAAQLDATFYIAFLHLAKMHVFDPCHRYYPSLKHLEDDTTNSPSVKRCRSFHKIFTSMLPDAMRLSSIRKPLIKYLVEILPTTPYLTSILRDMWSTAFDCILAKNVGGMRDVIKLWQLVDGFKLPAVFSSMGTLMVSAPEFFQVSVMRHMRLDSIYSVWTFTNMIVTWGLSLRALDVWLSRASDWMMLREPENQHFAWSGRMASLWRVVLNSGGDRVEKIAALIIDHLDRGVHRKALRYYMALELAAADADPFAIQALLRAGVPPSAKNTLGVTFIDEWAFNSQRALVTTDIARSPGTVVSAERHREVLGMLREAQYVRTYERRMGLVIDADGAQAGEASAGAKRARDAE